MKRKAIIFFILIVLIICCAGCSKSYTAKEINNRLSGEEEDKPEGFFISAWYNCENGSEIVIDKRTHVMYFYVYHGGLSPLYNADGTLRVWEDDTK